MGHEQFEEAVALYAIEALEPQERAALESHVASGCQECRAALAEYQEVAALLPYGLRSQPVPHQVKSHLMQAFRRDFPDTESDREKAVKMSAAIEHTPRAPAFGGFFGLFARPALGLACVVLLIGMTVYVLSLRTDMQKVLAERQQLQTTLRGELSDLRAQIAQRDRETADLRKEVAQREEIMTFLRSPNMKVVALSGLQAKSAGGFLLFDPQNRKAFFYAFNMPSLPPGKTYQLWAIMDRPVSAGTFDTDAGRKGRMLVDSVPGDVKKFAVSMEPEGGQLQPTGQIYLSGAL